MRVPSFLAVLILIGFGFFSAVPLSAQEGQPLPRGFSSLSLGMSFNEAEDALRGDSFFRYRGKPDVSLLAEENWSLIQCRGSSYLTEATLQFEDKILVVLTLMLNPREMDYFTLYSHLVSRYGEAAELNPSRAVWVDEQVRVSLEKPLTLRYMDEDFRMRREAVQNKTETEEALNKKEFLELF